MIDQGLSRRLVQERRQQRGIVCLRFHQFYTGEQVRTSTYLAFVGMREHHPCPLLPLLLTQ
jgi:hypothetical protein